MSSFALRNDFKKNYASNGRGNENKKRNFFSDKISNNFTSHRAKPILTNRLL